MRRIDCADLSRRPDPANEFPLETFADHFRAVAWEFLPEDVYGQLGFLAHKQMCCVRDAE